MQFSWRSPASWAGIRRSSNRGVAPVLSCGVWILAVSVRSRQAIFRGLRWQLLGERRLRTRPRDCVVSDSFGKDIALESGDVIQNSTGCFFFWGSIRRGATGTVENARFIFFVSLPCANIGFFGLNFQVSMYISKFRAAGNGAHGLLFQKLWAILLASFFPPCEVSSVITNCVLSRSKEIFDGIFAYILRNVNADGSNLLSYDVGYDGEEEDIIDTGADRYELLLQEASKKVSVRCV